ncbi:MAG TPA: disulfide bond formation protein B [Patescibacteria group bacterium]|nr:disulfide bond formation protein B [Patescibacteria group bacterium]
MKYLKPYTIYLPHLILIAALTGTLGSLYFSEILHFVPCDLCWWQRIFMYPLVPLVAVGIVLHDKKLPFYILSIAGIGWLISIYHNLLYYNIIPHPIVPCRSGVSCTDPVVQMFGFIDIPLGSFLTFTFILVCTIIYIKFNKQK